MIEKIISNFLPCLINILAVMYIISKMLDKKINFKSPKFYFVLFCITTVNIINYIYVDDFIRISTSTIALIVGNYILFKDDFDRIFIAVILEQMIMFISEIIVMLIIIEAFRMDQTTLFATIQGTLFINIVVSAIAIVIISCKPILNLMRKITKYIKRLSGTTKYLLMIILMVTLNVLLMFVYSSADNMNMLYINLAFILIYSFIIYSSLHEKNENMVFKAENKALMDNLSEYERVLNHQREMNHENNNQFVVIKGMIQQQEDAIGYIDQIIIENRVINNNLYKKTKHIPSGGMQGIIYQKILKMNEKNINSDLDINKNITDLDFSKIDCKLNYDICRILGVFLDNAIEETEKLKKSKRNVKISMYNETDMLVIEIGNGFNIIPDMEHMDEAGYTTKDDGHGYGLSLVKSIVEQNEKIIWKKEILNKMFYQIIKIKM